MADGTSDAAATLTGSAAAWLGERADELGVSDEVFLQRLVAAYRAVEETDADVDLATAAEVAELRDRLADVERTAERVEDVEAGFEEKVEDVRERVIQVKREADAKASADHDHPEVASQASAAATAAERAESDVEDLAERVDAGFENYETVLSYLRDETDDLNRKVTTLATAVLSMRESVAALAESAARQERVERLQTAANRAGVREADCEECGQSVDVALLTEPACPFCDAGFEDVEASSGWFGSHTLVTGDPPALAAGDSWMDEADDDSWLDDGAALEEMATDADDESADEPAAWGAESVDAPPVGDAVTDGATTEDTRHD